MTPLSIASSWFRRSLCILFLTPGASVVAQDTRGTLAVMYFTNSALIDHDRYEPLSKGIAEMLITELSGSTAIQIVERDRLQKLLEEQDLSGTGRVDKETAVRLGHLLGARHMLMGGFVIDPKQNLRLDVRAVNVETSRVEYVETVSGKAENVLGLIAALGARINTRLRLPPLPAKARPAARGPSKPDQLRAVMLLSRALNEQDRGNISAAIALYREALGVYPEYDRAKVLLASLEGSAGSRDP